jgi:hypothetical protein
VDVVGRVPTPESREKVLRLVEAEARQIRADVLIEDRLAVHAAVGERVA